MVEAMQCCSSFGNFQLSCILLLVQDMTSRELLQQRSTLANGDTTWRLAPLVVAALEGRLAVLDGVHRLDMGTLAVIKRWDLNNCLPSEIV